MLLDDLTFLYAPFPYFIFMKMGWGIYGSVIMMSTFKMM